MANTLITPSIIAKEALFQLKNNLGMARHVYREYKNEFVKVGDTISVRRPVKFTTQSGATLVKQDVTEGKFSLAVDQRKHVAWSFTSADLTLTIEEYSKRYIAPAMIALANDVDRSLLSLYTNVWNWAGTPGQTINSFADFAKGPELLDKYAVPQLPRMAALAPGDWWGMVGSQTSLFNEKMVAGAFNKGILKDVAGVGTFMDQNVYRHTNGTYAGDVRVQGAQSVTYASVADTNYQTLLIDGLTATSTLKAGQVFTISGVNGVNPVSKADTGEAQQFTILSDVSAVTDATTTVTVTIAPAIITSGAYQTVTAVAGNDATITIAGTSATSYPQSLVFHPNAFALVMVPLEMPDGAVWKARETDDGISVRVIKDYDMVNDEEVVRLDILYGRKAIYPDLATRLSGTA